MGLARGRALSASVPSTLSVVAGLPSCCASSSTSCCSTACGWWARRTSRLLWTRCSRAPSTCERLLVYHTHAYAEGSALMIVTVCQLLAARIGYGRQTATIFGGYPSRLFEAPGSVGMALQNFGPCMYMLWCAVEANGQCVSFVKGGTCSRALSAGGCFSVQWHPLRRCGQHTLP